MKKIGSKSVTLTWDAPDNNGGALVNAYLVEIKKPEHPEFTLLGKTSGDKCKWEALDLRPGVEYLFRVRAENSAGPGEEYAVLDKPVSPKGFGECRKGMRLIK